ncbi:23S rRNA (pseudouridine(1915)-N(3))-methyltransferase RlmH [Polymorphum gilvum]|uniref:Ribosomal RNA large subunit methyltransferase H n=1 Tax=Polymorphum gilvum (strain LMG 25793 / CGMCC 1.9160 / SL003B-26A1) TaxID=991905 RepID=F2J6T7_POLGS|nr:23S rRNA (pseudouridine(1915)-N(3))-methyltransferase RlmH [Polymorphum gilvum]ADZ72570.1 Ribosomal RNA large subunit methyltransferase H [Polymorphum gilvum SL003B-26A1]
MRFVFAAIGRMKAGSDKDLFDRYLDRARKVGRGLGVSAVEVIELAESRAARAEDRKGEEAAALLAALPGRARLVVLDEAGKAMTSAGFSALLQAWMDDGVSDIAFAIGGADGHGAAMIERADVSLAFGAMTWPHQIVRILLAEQVYRALTIQAGHPYHRA